LLGRDSNSRAAVLIARPRFEFWRRGFNCSATIRILAPGFQLLGGDSNSRAAVLIGRRRFEFPRRGFKLLGGDVNSRAAVLITPPGF
jgi:hypothetical protein